MFANLLPIHYGNRSFCGTAATCLAAGCPADAPNTKCQNIKRNHRDKTQTQNRQMLKTSLRGASLLSEKSALRPTAAVVALWFLVAFGVSFVAAVSLVLSRARSVVALVGVLGILRMSAGRPPVARRVLQ